MFLCSFGICEFFVKNTKNLINYLTKEDKGDIIPKEFKCSFAGKRREGYKVAEVRIKDGETLENAIRRFKRQVTKSGIMGEMRKREHYEKPSVKRKKKAEAARKRKYK